MAKTHFSGPLIDKSIQTGVVAGTTQTQAGAFQLSNASLVVVGTVAVANDGVRLPDAEVGQRIMVVNTTANSVQVYGFGTDTINAVATGTGVAQAAGKTAIYVKTAAGAWYRHLSA